VAIVVVTTILTFVTLVLGELAPKRLALQRAERWSLLAARPLAVLARVSAPAVWLLTRSTDLVVRLLGADPQRGRQEVTEEELRDLVATQPAFSAEQRRIISGAFEIDERTLREILVPRLQVLAFDERTDTREVVAQLVAASHTRAPVHRGDLDDVVGIVHVLDVVADTGPVGRHVRPATVLPETVGVLDALRRLQAEREQMAIVVNEHGTTEGIVTLEDLLEEIVGEIYDEFDRDLNRSDLRAVVHEPDGSLILPGSFPVHDLHQLGVSLPEGDYATVAGLVLGRLGRIPEPGDRLEAEGWRMEVLERQGNAIGRVRLTPLARTTG
jgi:putative hemolysin